MTLPTRQARPRRSLVSYFVAQPVSLPTFRELLEAAPADAWIALVTRACPASPDSSSASRFEIQLVIPSTARIERIEKFRGGIRQWSTIDWAIHAIDALLQEAGRAGELPVFVTQQP